MYTLQYNVIMSKFPCSIGNDSHLLVISLQITLCLTVPIGRFIGQKLLFVVSVSPIN